MSLNQIPKLNWRKSVSDADVARDFAVVDIVVLFVLVNCEQVGRDLQCSRV